MQVSHQIQVSGKVLTLTEDRQGAAVLAVAGTAIHLTPSARAALKAVL